MKRKHFGMAGALAALSVAVMLLALIVLAGCGDDNTADPTSPAAATVTSVTITAPFGVTTVAQGGTLQFTATVAGENNPAQTVNWSITTTGLAAGTSINSTSGLLTVDPAETVSATITVKAISGVDTSKSDTATVTVTAASTVTGVTVTPATPNVAKGDTLQFNAVVNGTNSPAQTVTWTISGGTGTTDIDSSGVLTVDPAETAASITVTATSTVDTSKDGSAIVTILIPTVNSVTVSPTTATVAPGTTEQFTVTVDVSNGAAQTVDWAVAGNLDPGTTINSSGVLTVDPGETATSITVTATSTVDITKSDTATVTVN